MVAPDYAPLNLRISKTNAGTRLNEQDTWLNKKLGYFKEPQFDFESIDEFILPALLP